MRFDSFDFLSPVTSKTMNKAESVMDLNTDARHNEAAKIKKTKPENDIVTKPFGAIGTLIEWDFFGYLCFLHHFFFHSCVLIIYRF